MRVFVLSTGRCGSMTFSKACSHITNYTSGHETRAHMIGPERLEYPDQHIEVDNRLSWFLGEIEHMNLPRPWRCYFVHLKRDPELVARSHNKRWGKGGIIEAFADGITMGHGPYDQIDEMLLCRWYVRTVNENIDTYLCGATHEPWMEFAIDDEPEERARRFKLFWRNIKAEGDLEAALAEFDTRHNASPKETP